MPAGTVVGYWLLIVSVCCQLPVVRLGLFPDLVGDLPMACVAHALPSAFNNLNKTSSEAANPVCSLLSG